MEFGFNFFPAVGPSECSAEQYFRECLELTELGDELGYRHVRIVEHYFHPYGGYSPNPLVFLAAAAQRTSRMRLITGAVLPIFNHPLKLAGEIGMVDALCGGRLEVGFARAFLPHEFQRFGRSLDESRARFDEGLQIVTRLLEEESVAHEGRFHKFPATTSLPRPTTKPRPPFWIACLSSEESFIRAGELGHSIMAIPLSGARMKELVDLYRDAYRAAGHGGDGRVMLAFHMYCAPTRQEALEDAREPVNRYLRSIVDAAGDWLSGTSSADYPGYDKMFAKIRDDSFDAQLEAGGVWAGDPETIVQQIHAYSEQVGGFESASLQVNFNSLRYDKARRSIELFAQEVMPKVETLWR